MCLKSLTNVIFRKKLESIFHEDIVTKIRIKKYTSSDGLQRNFTSFILQHKASEMIICMGINPSADKNTVMDFTNISLGRKLLVENQFKSIRGYYLINLSSIISSQPNEDVEKTLEDTSNHNKKVLKIALKRNMKVCLFFGRHIVNKNESIIKKLYNDLFEQLIEKGLLYYTNESKDFCHPSRKNERYTINQVTSINQIIP